MIELQEPQHFAQIERCDIDQIIEDLMVGLFLNLDHYPIVKILHSPVLQIIGDSFLNALRKQEILTIPKGIDFVLIFLNL